MPNRNGLYQPEGSEEFLDAVERFTSRKLEFRRSIGYLFYRSEMTENVNTLHDLLFTAKFVSKASSILTRTGPGSEGTDNLVKEYSKNLERASELLRALVSEAEDETATVIRKEFLQQSATGLNNLLKFLYELSWVKNYLMDLKR